MTTMEKLELREQAQERNAQRVKEWAERQKGEQTMTDNNPYKLSREEKETTIRWDAEEKIAHIYSADPVYRRRLRKLCDAHPETYKLIKDIPDGIFVEAPADRIAFRNPPTEAQIEHGKQIGKKNQEKAKQLAIFNRTT